MDTKAPRNSEDPGRVLQFTPRKAPKSHAFSNLSRQNMQPDDAAVRDLSKFTKSGNESDDFSHRMKMNALAGIVLVALVGGGLWIVDVMAQMRKDHDCALSGRRNCTQISLPVASP